MKPDDATGSGKLIVVNVRSLEIEGFQKELGGRQDEGAENGTRGLGEISNNVTFQDPVEKAMTNPVILLNVFSNLKFDALVKLRLVCKLWDEVVRTSPEFRNMFWIHVPRLFPCCAIAPVPDINPNLAKNIFVTDMCWSKIATGGQLIHVAANGGQLSGPVFGMPLSQLHDPKRTAGAAAYNLTTFFTLYHHYVKNIRFGGQYFDSFYTELVKALNVLEFPQLQGIVVKDMFKRGNFEDHWRGYYKDDLISTFVTYLAKPNLTSLQLDNTAAGSPFLDIFQKLINCAPNLEKITINGNFYPDLSTCKNLKILNYSGIPYYHTERNTIGEEPSFNLKLLSKMLDEAKHSLIKLSLKDSYLDCSSLEMDRHRHSKLEDFKFPDMAKKLQILTIQENSKPFFQPELKKLNPVLFPKLKNLSIIVKSLDNVLEGISDRFVTISSLHLSGTISPNMRPRIPTLFPNLTSLTMPWSVESRDEKPDFNEVIDFCSGWKLRKLDIGTVLQSDWSAFMIGLCRLKQTQNNIRMLELPSQNNASGEESKPAFELWYDARQQEQAIGTMNVDIGIGNLSFGPHSMKEGMEGAVLEFILKHPLKVHFI